MFVETVPKHNISPSTRFFPHKDKRNFDGKKNCHESLVEKFKIFVQDFVTIKNGILWDLFFSELCLRILKKF